jgi:hypothetical protein
MYYGSMKTQELSNYQESQPESDMNSAEISLLGEDAVLALGGAGIQGSDGAELVPFGFHLAHNQSITNPGLLEYTLPQAKTMTPTSGTTVIPNPHGTPTTKQDPGADKVDDD